jgi:hypothetical protein
MQDKDAGIALETHEVQDNKVYRHCFSGTYSICIHETAYYRALI